jgi:hypothetical protein
MMFRQRLELATSELYPCMLTKIQNTPKDFNKKLRANLTPAWLE